MEAEPRLFLATLSQTVASVSLRLFSPCGFPEPGVQEVVPCVYLGSHALWGCPACGGISIHSFPSEELGTLLRLLLPERKAQVEDFIVCKRKVQVGKLPSWELPVT